MAKCLNCGEDVMQTPGKRPRLYCSGACGKAFQRKAAIPDKTSLPDMPLPDKTTPDAISGQEVAMLMKANPVRYWTGNKTFETRQESDAEFTRLMAQDDRSRANQRVSKPGDADYEGACCQVTDSTDGAWHVPKRQAVGAER